MMHPFDMKQALLAKHAQHVVLIHFPIALFVVGAIFDWIGHFRGSHTLRSAAYCNFVVAALSAPLAVLTGILAWQLQLGGQRLHGMILLHLILGTTSAVLILLVWWIHFRTRGRSAPKLQFVLEAAGVVVIVLTGHLGGFLSGVNT